MGVSTRVDVVKQICATNFPRTPGVWRSCDSSNTRINHVKPSQIRRSHPGLPWRTWASSRAGRWSPGSPRWRAHAIWSEADSVYFHRFSWTTSGFACLQKNKTGFKNVRLYRRSM